MCYLGNRFAIQGNGRTDKNIGDREKENTYDLIGDVMPHIRLPLGLPLGVLGDHELQVRVGRPRLARDPAGLHLDEVRLEEVDLVLAVHARRVRVLAHHREMVVYLAAVYGRFRLRD